MKKLLSVGLLSLLGVASAVAAPVTKERAASVAAAFLSQQPDAPTSVAVKSIENIGSELYLVNFAPKGYVIVSADDTATPVFGFSATANVSIPEMPENMRHIIDESRQTVKGRIALNNIDATWSRIEKNDFVRSRAGNEEVAPLIPVNWAQGNPYNQFCPGEGSNKAVVGCVAVAMSQAMSVQRYPVKAQGQKTYTANNYGQLSINYDAETPYDWDAILKGSGDNYKEAARLMYHAGVSVEMGYGSDGSGIPSNQVYRITNALKNHFGYGSDVTYYWRNEYKGDWEQLLLNELYAGRAVVYNAIDSKGGYGHSFNIDGFRDNGGSFFHVNWGWGERYNSYYKIDALNDPSMNMNYDTGHVAVVGIGAADSPLRSVMLSDLDVESNSPVGSPVSAVLVNGEVPDNSVYNINVTGAHISGNSYESIPFEYRNGILYIKSAIPSGTKSIYVRVQASLKGQTGPSLIQGFTVNIIDPVSIQHKTSFSYDRSSKMMSVHTKFGASYKVKNSAGAEVLSGTLSSLPEFEISRAALAPGKYTIEITVASDTYSFDIEI